MVDAIIGGYQGLEIAMLRWGLVPFGWKRSLSKLPSTHVARSETADKDRMFRHAYGNYRCLVPASGFYKRTRGRSETQTSYIRMTDGSPMTFAGLWEDWHEEVTDQRFRTCTILTTVANRLMKSFDRRMPVILTENRAQLWLQGGYRSLLNACPSDLLTAHQVNDAVWNMESGGADLLQPVT